MSSQPEQLVTHPRALWSVDSIAAWCDYAPNYVANKIVMEPDFPRPIRVMGENARPRWLAGEVMDWFESRRAS